VLVLTDGEVVGAHQADTALGVGSAFKLLILDVLQDAIAAGDLAWDGVATLEDRHISLPSGVIQDWPIGSPMTLSSLANLMISVSDNTATDLLIEVVGRDALEARSPLNTPFLTTGELFRLKAEGNEGALEAFIAEDDVGQREVLDGIAGLPLPEVDDDFLSEPILEVEWFFTATELCGLLAETAALPAVSINPGLAQETEWARIAYKGGSEAGVLNFSTWVVGDDGREHCVVATWNDTEPVDQAALVAPYAGILDRLAGGE